MSSSSLQFRVGLILTVIGLACAFLPPAGGNERASGSGASNSTRDNDLRGRFFGALFDNELPFTRPGSAWELRFHPKVSDVLKESYIRLPVELRYGFTDNREGQIGFTPFVGNPFDSGHESSWGYFNVGIKQRIYPFISNNWDLAVGARARLPLDEIPAPEYAIRANYALYEPYFVLTRQSRSKPRWQHVLNASYGMVSEEPFGLVDVDGPVPRSLLRLRPGAIFKPPGEWRYSLEFDYLTERLDGGNGDAFAIVPGVAWFPDKRRDMWVPGDLEFNFTVACFLTQLPEEEERGDVRVALRVRWRLDSRSRQRIKDYLRGNGNGSGNENSKLPAR